MPTCPLREEKSFSQRVFSIYTDIRKLQDKAKTSLIKGLGLQPLQTGDNPRKYLEDKLKELINRPITDEEIKKLFCTKDLDSCIRKIVVRVPANNILKDSFTEVEVDEYITGIQEKTNLDYEEMEDMFFLRCTLERMKRLFCFQLPQH